MERKREGHRKMEKLSQEKKADKTTQEEKISTKEEEAW